MKKDIPPVPDPITHMLKSEAADTLDSKPEDVHINFEEEDRLHYELKLNPELRNVFFEQDKEENCILVANEEPRAFANESFSEFYSRVIRQNISRTFLVELHKRLAKAAHTTSHLEYAQLYKGCKNEIDRKFTDKNAVYIHDSFREKMTEFTFSKLKSQLNDRWRIVQCLLDTCPIVAAGPALPVFSVEPVGRDGWTLTTYGEHPHQHQLFPGVPLTIAPDEGLLYTATLTRVQKNRRLCMLDQT